jgi:hypothetical protein
MRTLAKPKKGVVPPALAAYMAAKKKGGKPAVGKTTPASHLAGPKRKSAK